MFEPLQDPACFALVTVDPEAGTLVWPNELDLDPDVLYTVAHGWITIPQAGVEIRLLSSNRRPALTELGLVELAVVLPEHGLEAGDIGTVVHLPPDGATAEVEFARADGETVAMLTLGKAQIRPFDGPRILHARPVRA